VWLHAVLTSSLDGLENSPLQLASLSFRTAPQYDWMEVWMGSRAGLNCIEKRKMRMPPENRTSSLRSSNLELHGFRLL
jgi:hypothetical protein